MMSKKRPKSAQNQQPGERLHKHADNITNDQIQQRLEELAREQGWAPADPPTPSGAEVQAMGQPPTKSQNSDSEPDAVTQDSIDELIEAMKQLGPLEWEPAINFYDFDGPFTNLVARWQQAEEEWAPHQSLLNALNDAGIETPAPEQGLTNKLLGVIVDLFNVEEDLLDDMRRFVAGESAGNERKQAYRQEMLDRREADLRRVRPSIEKNLIRLIRKDRASKRQATAAAD